MIIDLHVMAPVADGGTAIDQVLDFCLKAGLDGACLVGPSSAPPVAESLASPAAARLRLFFGVEFVVERGRLVWIPGDTGQFESGQWRDAFHDGRPTATAVAGLVSERGGALFAAHPYDRTGGPAFADGVYHLTGLSAIEVANASCDPAIGEFAVEAAMRMRIGTVAGNGSWARPDSIGNAATVFPEAVDGQQGLVDAINKGETFALEILSSLGGGRHDRGDRHVDQRRGGDGPDRRGPFRGPGGGRHGGRGRGPDRGLDRADERALTED